MGADESVRIVEGENSDRLGEHKVRAFGEQKHR